MKILRIVYDWPDENTITEGLAPAPYELSISQAKLGHKIYVLCGNLNGRNFKKLRFWYRLQNGRIVVFNLPRGLKNFGPFITTSVFIIPYYFVLRIFVKPDLVHNHGHLGVWLMLYKFLFRWIDKTPVIGHFHITSRGRENALKKNGVKIPFVTRFFEYPIHSFSDFLMCRISKRLITVSYDLKNELIKFYRVDSTKIRVIESGVDTLRFTKDGDRWELGFPKDSIIIGNGGRLSKRKNIDLLVESLKYLDPKFKLVLWGHWENKNFKKLIDSIIDENHLSDRVKYLGSVSYFSVEKYYRACDIFVLPSSYEGLPKVVIEAMACGCKVLASGFKMGFDVPDIKMLEGISPKSIASEIERLQELKTDYESTQQIISSHYSWDSKAKEVEEVYKHPSGAIRK